MFHALHPRLPALKIPSDFIIATQFLFPAGPEG
jgi:hypothetical protein